MPRATAEQLATKVDDPQAVEAKIRSDIAQAKPAGEATRGQGRRGTKARKRRGTGAAAAATAAAGLSR